MATEFDLEWEVAQEKLNCLATDYPRAFAFAHKVFKLLSKKVPAPHVRHSVERDGIRFVWFAPRNLTIIFWDSEGTDIHLVIVPKLAIDVEFNCYNKMADFVLEKLLQDPIAIVSEETKLSNMLQKLAESKILPE